MRPDNEKTVRDVLGRMADEAPEPLEFGGLGLLSSNRRRQPPGRWAGNPAVAMVLAATSVLLLIGLVAALTLPRTGEPADPFLVQTEPSAVAVPETSAIPYKSPVDAAIATARAQGSDFNDAKVTRIVGIYADQSTVDLRVKVEAGGSCQYYAVTGRVRENAIEWRSGPALPCG